MKYILIKGGKVDNLIEADEEFAQQIQKSGGIVHLVPNGSFATLGQSFEAGSLVEPPMPVDTRTWSEKRRDEYPSFQQIIEALIEREMGRPEQLAQVILQRIAVMAKYPKP